MAWSVNAIRSEPNGPWGRMKMMTTTPTTTGGSASPALARSWSARRPRKRPRPSAAPIGRPMMTAAVVETAARRSVTESRPIRYGSPCTISGTALLIWCHR